MRFGGWVRSFARPLARPFVGTHRFPAENAEFIGNWRGSHNSRLGLTLMPPLLRASQIGKGVKLTATYLWRGRDAIRHEDSGFARSRGCGEPALPTIYFAIIGPDVNIWPRPSPRRTTSILEGTSPNPPSLPPSLTHIYMHTGNYIFRHARLYGFASSNLVVCLGKFNICRRLKDTKLKLVAKYFQQSDDNKSVMLVKSF